MAAHASLRWRAGIAWGGYALALAVAPLLWPGGFALGLLSQIGIAIVACLAFNILLGQGGMLSFGHAVYSGVGALLAIHALNRVASGALALPVSLVPLVGGGAGLLLAALLGWVSTRQSGTAFAMITLGLGELVGALWWMVPDYFGGEGGITANRVAGPPVLGISFGPQRQVYGLIAVYCFISTVLMHALTRTPLGLMLNAVRDNPERAEFIGHSARQVRYRAFMISGFFSGVAGGLAALNFELVTADAVSAARSGALLMFVYLGGATGLIGPMLGAVLMVLALVLLSGLTQAWLLYLGLAFIAVVMVAPGGLAGLVMAALRLAARGRWRAMLPGAALLLPAGLLALAGAATLIEMAYHLRLQAAMGPHLPWLGLVLGTGAPADWLAAALLLAAGTAVCAWAWPVCARRWAALAGDIAADTRADGPSPEVPP